MYAVIETGGKQVRVQAGDIIQVEKLIGDVGAQVTFDKVLFVSSPSETTSEVSIGMPYLSEAKVSAEIVAQGRGDKVTIIKMKRRKQYRRTQGHRQEQTQLLVLGVSEGAKTKELSAADKKLQLAKFFTTLKPKGPASQAKTLGSRVKLTAAKKAASIEAKKTGAPKATASKTTSAPKAAPKTTAAKTTKVAKK
ncbi:MAG: 50S ribosomal protein L21 [Bdellovibrionales bacterium]|nr:50S ribosomal protein L21 [Oligoflexia bacterium]